MYARRTAFHILIALALVLGLGASALPTSSVSADTLTVCAGGGCGYTTIQAAIAAASAGDTITVAAGTYTEIGQIVIDKNLTIVGADAATTIIKPGQDTGGSGDAMGWFLVKPSVTFNLSQVTLDGDGHLARVGIRTQGSGSISNTIIKNMFYSTYEGWGIAMDWATAGQVWNITNNRFENIQRIGILVDGQTNQATLSGNTFIGKGTGDWVNYGIEVGDGAAATISGNSFTGYSGIASTDGSESAGIMVTSYFGPNPSATVTSNTFSDSSYGIMGGYYADDSSTITATGNTFTNITTPVTLNNPAILDVAGTLAANTFDRSIVIRTGGTISSPAIYSTIQPAIDAAAPGDTIEVGAGTYVLSTAVEVNKDVTIACDPAALIQVSGTGYRIQMTAAGASLVGCSIQKTDKAGVQNIIYVAANDLTIQDNTIWGQFVIGEGDVSRAMEFTGGLSGLLITNNEIHHLRQPAYINGLNSGTILNNYVYATKGWVVAGGNLTFTGNTWGTGADANVFDIAILSGVGPLYYTDVPAMSADNNNASIEDQRTAPATLNPVYVDASAPACTADCGTAAHPYPTLAQGITRVTPGGTIHVATGTYNEEMLIGKSITILGPNADISPNTGTRVAEAVIAPLNQAGVADPAILTTAGSMVVTIKGLTFDMGNTTDDSDRFVESINKTGITWVFEKNIFTNAPSAINGNWYITGTTAPSSFTLLDNYFYHSKDSNGISLWGDGHTIDIRDNVWKDNGGWAVNFNNVTGTFSGNQVLDTEENGPEWYDEQAGFLFASANDLDLNNNLMDGLPNPYIRIYPNFSGPFSMTGNTFINSEDPTMGVIRIGDGADLTNFVVENNSFVNDPLVFQMLGAQTFDGSPNWFGSINGPAAGMIDGDVTYIPWWANAGMTILAGPVHNVTQDTYFATIQAAINAAANGDTIQISAGTFEEQVIANDKDNLTVIGAGEGQTIIKSPATLVALTGDRKPVFGVNSSENFTIKNLTIDGAGRGNANYRFYGLFYYNSSGLIDHITAQDIRNQPLDGAQSGVAIYGYVTDSVARTITATHNTAINYQKGGLTFNGAGLTAIVEYNTATGIGQTPLIAMNGIQIGFGATGAVRYNTTSGNWYTGNPTNGVAAGILLYQAPNVVVEGNTISTSNLGIAASGSDNVSILSNILSDNQYSIDLSGLGAVVEFNQITGSVVQAFYSEYPADASPNWWGSMAGPGAGMVEGDVAFAPWCAQAACTSFLPVAGVIEIPAGTPGADVQTILNNAPEGTTIKFMGSPLPNTGGYVINTPHLTIILADGTVIQNNSPCFVVNADYTTIQAATIGGAQCVPTADSNGIDVTGVRKNITITGIEFVGTTGTDGIHFGTSGTDSITDIVLVDNWFHGFASDGIEFFTQPLGVIDIHGNLFQVNGGLGINNANGTTPIDATYNSWGVYAGPTLAGANGVSANVTYAPWTHVDLYMTSSGTPWADQVVAGQYITYTVYGNLQNVNAADFTLRYPTGLTYDSHAASGTFTNELITPATGSINFLGYDLSGTETGLAQPLFTVTFKATADSILNLDELTDGFGMATSGSSSNVFAADLLDKTVNVIDLPTLTSLDLVGPYVQNIPQTFTLTITNPAEGGSFSAPALQFSLPASTTLEYYNGSTWVAWPATIPGITPGTTTDLLFRVTFSAVGPQSVTVTLVDTLSTPANTTLATLTQAVNIYQNLTVTGTFSMQGRSTRAGIPVTLTATILTYGPFSATSINQISANISFSNVVADTYLITTNQPRYLDVIAALGKTKVIDATTPANLAISALELKGGDANDDNQISSGDSSVIGAQYGTTGTNGDVNFDGKVDIKDLAIVGGNYNLTSATYGSWVP